MTEVEKILDAEMNEKLEKIKENSEKIGKIVGKFIGWFLSAGFIYWGWTIVAPHLNAPEFGYWEIFAIRMALGSIIGIFKK